jgi:hypothetical protein
MAALAVLKLARRSRRANGGLQNLEFMMSLVNVTEWARRPGPVRL